MSKTKKPPAWARPVFGPYSCSICKNPEVFYMRSDSWIDEEDIGEIIIETHLFAMKCWCKGCFQECGGKINGQGLSSDPATA